MEIEEARAANDEAKLKLLTVSFICFCFRLCFSCTHTFVAVVSSVAQTHTEADERCYRNRVKDAINGVGERQRCHNGTRRRAAAALLATSARRIG
jgi:hypothetical protein